MADFFDKMIDGFNKNVAIVSAGSKVVVEKGKINNSIKNLEDEKRRIVESIGNKVYSYYIANQGDIPRNVIEPLCSEIVNREEQIKSLKLKVEELDNEMNIVKTAASTQTIEAEVVEQHATKVCSCGFTNEENAKFCGKCGNKLD